MQILPFVTVYNLHLLAYNKLFEVETSKDLSSEQNDTMLFKFLRKYFGVLKISQKKLGGKIVNEADVL